MPIASERLFASATALAITMAVTGCASIMSGNKQIVTFQSSPENATVTVAGRVLGKTPISISLDKKQGQNLVFALPGYKTVEMQLTTQIDGWF
jgi:hypothetical protein